MFNVCRGILSSMFVITRACFFFPFLLFPSCESVCNDMPLMAKTPHLGSYAGGWWGGGGGGGKG